MKNFIELNYIDNCGKVLVNIDDILCVEECEDYSFIATGFTKKGFEGFKVVELYDDIIRMIYEAKQ